MAREEALDAAILDVNLDGEEITPVSQQLQARDIPFILSTGYGALTLPDELHGFPVLEKPFVGYELERAMTKLCARA
jgi:hypothetical protein